MTTTARKRVLFVDDDIALRRLVTSFLAEEFDVVTEASGEAALERAARGERFDVIVTDLDLPGMNGQNLFAKLRARQPDLARRVAFTSSVDAVPGEITDLEAGWLERKLKMYDLQAPNGVRSLKKIVAGKRLWNYDNLEPTEKKIVL